jgi:chemotaxis signal transduction protein
VDIAFTSSSLKFKSSDPNKISSISDRVIVGSLDSLVVGVVVKEAVDVFSIADMDIRRVKVASPRWICNLNLSCTGVLE